MPWKMLMLTVHSSFVKGAFNALSVNGPLTTVISTMTSIPINAKPEALANLEISLFNDNGYEMHVVKITIIVFLRNIQPITDEEAVMESGINAFNTWGIVSPMITQKAIHPPYANELIVNKRTILPYLPKQ